VRAERTTAEAAALRLQFVRADTIIGFALESLVDGEAFSARWVAGGALECDRPLRDRAQIVVAMGETFETSSGGRKVCAKLDGTPVAALLTLMRASSRVLSFQFEYGRRRTFETH